MARYLIEIPHDPSPQACDLAVKVLRETGSHFITHADLGCPDKVHKAWLAIEVANRRQALMVVPVAYRHRAKVIRIKRLHPDKIKDLKSHHQ